MQGLIQHMAYQMHVKFHADYLVHVAQLNEACFPDCPLF